jgi:hypothetical protein
MEQSTKLSVKKSTSFQSSFFLVFAMTNPSRGLVSRSASVGAITRDVAAQAETKAIRKEKEGRLHYKRHAPF